MLEFDVVVIGGGPAGATVGTLVRKYNPGLTVAIVEKERFPRDHVGESHLPAISRILAEMDVWDKIEAANFPIKIGGTYRWGATDELWDLDFYDHKLFVDEPRPARFEGQRLWTAFQVDRSIYDKILLDHTQACGCTVFENTKVVRVEKTNDKIECLQLESDETVKARYYVDCSGETGILRRAFDIGVQSPTALRNIAIWDYWNDATWAVTIGNGGTRILVMSLGWGWLWFIPITPTRTSVGLVLPAVKYKEFGKSKEDLYLEAIASEPYLAELLKDASREGKTEATKDWNFLADRLCGDNWFLAGDACGFADPILSAGMTLAHTSGRKIAYTITELERGRLDPNWLKQEYNQSHRAQILHHMRFADYWYAGNGRFTDLKDHCAEIARTVGLELDSDTAFRWLATGGFAVEEPGLARAVGFGVAGLKVISGRFGQDELKDWELTKTNLWRLNLRDAEEETLARYENGGITPVKSFRRDEKRLPVTGVYSIVVRALERNPDSIAVLEYCVNSMIGDGCPPDEAVRSSLEAFEALIVEGWIKGKAISSRPFIKVNPSTAFR